MSMTMSSAAANWNFNLYLQ